MDMQDTTRTNREHKDRLFRFLFKNKTELLSLYNAINDSNYTDPEDLEIYTMEDYVYMGMKNDLSFLIDWNLNVFEHQSTYNPNMPLRGFLYTAASLKKFIELNRLDLFSSKRITIPIPRFYVFYNGMTEMKDEVELYLTDNMYQEDMDGKSCMQFVVHMININAGYNFQIMEKCPTLYEYSLFVAETRKNTRAGMPLKEGIQCAVEECIRKGILENVLRGNKAEVTDMLLKEYDEALHISTEKKISYEEGFLEGQLKERKNTEREKERADRIEKENEIIQKTAVVLKYKLKGKKNEEICQLTKLSLEQVENILEESMK